MFRSLIKMEMELLISSNSLEDLNISLGLLDNPEIALELWSIIPTSPTSLLPLSLALLPLESGNSASKCIILTNPTQTCAQ